MEASTKGGGGFKAKGSFGVPAEMQRDLEEQRRKVAAREADGKAGPAPAVGPDVPDVTSAEAIDAKAKETAEANQEEQFKKLKASVEERLDSTITQDDIKEYIFKGALTKEVTVIPGILKCAFKTLTPTEYLEIDAREAGFRNEGKYTSDGIINQRALVTLSYAWIAADGKPLSSQNEPGIREKHIRKLGAHLVEAAVAANTDFNTLLKLTLQEKAFVKKS